MKTIDKWILRRVPITKIGHVSDNFSFFDLTNPIPKNTNDRIKRKKDY